MSTNTKCLNPRSIIMVTFHSERLKTEEDITLQGAVTRSHTSEPNDYKYGFTLATLIILQNGKVSIYTISLAWKLWPVTPALTSTPLGPGRNAQIIFNIWTLYLSEEPVQTSWHVLSKLHSNSNIIDKKVNKSTKQVWPRKTVCQKTSELTWFLLINIGHGQRQVS